MIETASFLVNFLMHWNV